MGLGWTTAVPCFGSAGSKAALEREKQNYLVTAALFPHPIEF